MQIFLARSYFFILRGQLGRKEKHRDSAVGSTLFQRFAYVGLFCLLGEFQQRETQRRSSRNAPSLDLFADVSFSRQRGRIWKSRHKGDSAEMVTSLDHCFLTAQMSSKVALQQKRVLVLYSASARRGATRKGRRNNRNPPLVRQTKWKESRR